MVFSRGPSIDQISMTPYYHRAECALMKRASSCDESTRSNDRAQLPGQENPSKIAKYVTFAGKFGRRQNFVLKDHWSGRNACRKTRARLRRPNFAAISVAETYIYGVRSWTYTDSPLGKSTILFRLTMYFV